MHVVTVMKDSRVKGRYLIDIDYSGTALAQLKSLRPGYAYIDSKLDFDDGIYEMFWEDDDPKCETCKHEFELKKEVKISVAEFKGKTYRIPEKHWTFVKLNLRHYQ